MHSRTHTTTFKGLTLLLGACGLAGSLLLNGYSQGGGADIAAAASPPPADLLTLLNEMNAKLDALTTQEGNHTLRWDTNNPSASRFVTLAAFGGQAVLDKNTGLVWEQAPDTTGGPSSNGLRTWPDATFHCANRNVAGTRGWRLPSVAELASLIDPTLPAPFVPAGVFTGVQSSRYWSASTNAENPAIAWDVDFGGGVVSNGGKTATFYTWCVRGGMQESEY